MARTNLIPVVVTDKNGRVTTVHRKDHHPLAPSSMPAPAANVLRPSLVAQAALAKIESYIGFQGSDRRKHDTLVSLRTYTPDQLNEIDQILGSGGVLARGVARHISDGELPEIILETVHFHNLMKADDYWESAAMVRSLGQYDMVRAAYDLRNQPMDFQQRCVALMRAARSISKRLPENRKSESHPILYIPTDYYFNMEVIKDERLVEMIFNQPDDADVIAEVVAKHGTTDPSVVNGIMNGIKPSIAEGSL